MKIGSSRPAGCGFRNETIAGVDIAVDRARFRSGRFLLLDRYGVVDTATFRIYRVTKARWESPQGPPFGLSPDRRSFLRVVDDIVSNNYNLQIVSEAMMITDADAAAQPALACLQNRSEHMLRGRSEPVRTWTRALGRRAARRLAAASRRSTVPRSTADVWNMSSRTEVGPRAGPAALRRGKRCFVTVP
jgi:hypothetical protein